MRAIRILFVFLLVSSVSLSQTFDEIDITNFSNVDGWTYLGLTDGFDTYYKSNVGCFDRIILLQFDSKTFYVENPNVPVFESIYNHLRNNFGEEDINVDFIRYGTDVNDDENFCKAIREGNATISRTWILYDIRICLDWFYDNNMSKDMIVILSYYK